jgi:tRNA pseudouridine38-40 synthase
VTPRAPVDEAAHRGPLRRVVLVISYDGSGFSGFATQRGQRTVQGDLEDALEQMTGAPVSSRCAGRTDTGVHALAQVVHVDLDANFVERDGPVAALSELPALARSLSKQLGPEIAVWRCLLAPEGFDARHSALARRYRYVVETDPRRDPLYRGASWFVAEPLDLAVMRLGCEPLLGEHDFSAFCRQPKGKPHGPLRRRVTDASWHEEDSRLVFEIEANAFCHQMVRSIVAMEVSIGRGKTFPSEITERLREPDRSGLPRPAPPGGLCLLAVTYPKELGGSFE